MTRARILAAGIVVGILAGGWLAANGALWYRTADFYCLREGARLLMTGGAPYDPEAWRPVIEGRYPDPFRGTGPSSCVARYASPLWTAVVMIPFALLPLEIAASLWMAFSIAAVVAGIRWIWLAAGGSARLAPVFGVLVIASQPFWLLLVGGQVNGLMVGLVGATTWLGARGRDTLAGAALGALVLKPQIGGAYAPALLLRDLLRGRSRALIGAVAAVAMLTVASLSLRPTWPAEWLEEVGGRRLGYAHLLPTAWGFSQDVFGTMAWSPLLIVLSVGLMAAIVRGRPLDRTTFGALALPLSLFAMPHVWSYDFVVLALPWGVALALADRAHGRRRWTLLAAIALVASPMPWSMFAIGLARGQENWSAVVPVVSAAAVAIAHRLSNVRIISDPRT